MSDTQYSYQPGVCNINLAEVGYRRKVSRIAIAVSVAIAIVAFTFNLEIFLIPVATLAMFIGVLNYLQAKNNFCVSYAAQSRYNPDEEFAKTHKVVNATDHKQDMQKSREMYLQSGISTVIFLVTLVVFALIA